MKTITKAEIALAALIIILAVGTIAYHNLEGWSYVDSFYFTGVTMTTVGYGDLHPTTTLSKIFTVFFGFAGVGISLFALTLFATQYFETREKKFGILLERRFIEDLRQNFSPKTLKKKQLKMRREILKGSKI